MASVPAIFDDTPFAAFDPFDVFSGFKFPDPSAQVFGRHSDRLMKTDVRETEKGYTLMIRSERSTGACSRTFYVGEGVKEGDCKASFEDGILTVQVPKVGAVEPQKRLISIQ